MKKFVVEFLRRGLVACGLGPLILALLYLILRRVNAVETLTVNEVCVGIATLWGLAFVAGGMNAVYQVERLPLMVAILIHGTVLYLGYLATYLLNSWLDWGITPVMVFTGIFVLGFLVIWVIIYSSIKKNTDKVNAALRIKKQDTDIL